MNDRILAVADGMGGHSRGEVASRIAIETVTEYADVLTNSSADPDEMREAVDAVFQLASERIEAEAAGAQMGTTLVFAVLAPNGSTVYIAHAGDSRAYLKRRGLLRIELQEDGWRQCILTPEGSATVISILAQAKAAESDAFSDFSQAEQAQLKGYLRRLADKMASGL